MKNSKIVDGFNKLFQDLDNDTETGFKALSIIWDACSIKKDKGLLDKLRPLYTQISNIIKLGKDITN